jgi:hypothetical protein
VLRRWLGFKQGKEKFSARQFSMPAAEKSSAGLLTPNKTQPLSSMPSIWLSGRARRRPAESFMPIMESKVDSTGRRNTLTSEVFKDGDGRLE